MTSMNRLTWILQAVCFLVISLFAVAAGSQSATTSAKTFVLTVQVENVNKDAGNVGMLVFNSSVGWPENRFIALKDITVPAHPGTVTIAVPGLPAGDYAVAILHDVNKNHKMDKNFFGMPKEQWGMSNNPHATVKAPSFDTAKFSLSQDMEIHVKMQ